MAGFGDWAGLLGQGISDTVNGAIKIFNNERNIQMQKDTNALNETLMREAWARDDTSRQRMVKDFENAGLSKWLSTGASPMASSPISLTAPKSELDGMINGEALQHAYQNALYAEQTRKQNELIGKQAEIAQNNIEESKAKAEIAKHDAEVFSNRPGVASNDPQTLKYITEILNYLRGDSKFFKNEPVTLPDGTSMDKGELQFWQKLGILDENGNIIDIPKEKPLSFSAWCKMNQIDLSTPSNQKRASTLYNEYKSKF